MFVTIPRFFRFIVHLLLLVGFTLRIAATTVVPPEFPVLVNESDYIVHARVTDVRSEWRTDRVGGDIVTFVTLEVIEVVAGHPPAVPVLRFLGGQVGDDVVRIVGSPRFVVGDEDILFVRGNGRSLCPLYAMGHGRYPIAEDAASGRREVHLATGRPLTSIAAISETLHLEEDATHGDAPIKTMAAEEPEAMAVASFISQIRAEVRPGSRVTQNRIE